MTVVERPFEERDLDGAWLVVAAAPPEVNRQVAAAAERARHVRQSPSTTRRRRAPTAAGVLRRGGVTVAISTDGQAPALAGLLREALEAVLPDRARRAGSPRPTRSARSGAPRACRWPSAGRCCCARSTGSMTRGTRATNERRPDASRWSAPVPAIPSCSPCAARAAWPKPISCSTTRSSSEGMRELAPTRALVLRRQARRPQVDRSGRAQPPDDPRRAARPARRAPQVRRPVRVRARRRRGAGARRGRHRRSRSCPACPSAIAAPALAGIPVTHRGLASGFAVITGHAEHDYGRCSTAFRPARSRWSCSWACASARRSLPG